MRSVPASVEEITTLAAEHELRVDPSSVTVIEAGLDFRVARARDDTGRDWVLRIPRRPDAARRARAEAAVLTYLRSRLSVAVPDWRVSTPELIAYPALPGEPGLTYDPGTGEVTWRLDAGSPAYAESLGRVLAELHALSPHDTALAQLPVYEPGEVRDRWRRDIATVRTEFEIAEQLEQRWRHWLADGSYWPGWSVLTHGEVYPAHVLIDADDQVTGILDWTTAEIGDPARDLVYQHAMAPAEAFKRTVAAYVAAGGRVWPRLAEHCGHLWSTGPVNYALFALQTGESEHRATAQRMLVADPEW